METLSKDSSSKPTLLLVDDRKENLIALKSILKKLDVNILMANTGHDALNLLIQHEIAVLLLDVQMPVMNGFELANLILNNPKTQHIPIIFVTSLSTEDFSVRKGFSEGAVDYILKPVDPFILLSKVKIFLKIYQQTITLKETARQLDVIQKNLSRMMINWNVE